MVKHFIITTFLVFLQFYLSICDDDLSGLSSIMIYHSLEPSTSSPKFTPRGVVTYYSSRNEAIYTEEALLSADTIEKLKKLVTTDDIYQVKIHSKSDRAFDYPIFSSTKACAVYESKLSDSLTITLDQSGSPIGIAISASSPFCSGEPVDDVNMTSFNTTVNIVSLVNGPLPDTLTYIQRLEQEKAEKARGEQGDNRSFLAKYWMYIVPFVLFLFISSASSPDQPGSGGR